VFGLKCIGHVTSGHLQDFSEADARPVLALGELPDDRDLIFWCSRAVADLDPSLAVPDEPAAFVMDGKVVGLFIAKGTRPDAGFLNDLAIDSKGTLRVDVLGRVLEWVWELMLETPEQLTRDLASAPGSPVDALPQGAYSMGSHNLILGADVDIEPGTVFDTREGPIQLGDGVQVKAGTRLAGPAAIGEHSRLLGGSFESLSAGPFSYLHGEISETVILGYTNKAHDGFLGHAYLGKWVNLGAMTTNSDLKNNYGPVRVWTPSGTLIYTEASCLPATWSLSAGDRATTLSSTAWPNSSIPHERRWPGVAWTWMNAASSSSRRAGAKGGVDDLQSPCVGKWQSGQLHTS
jgi:hypothetical protein